MRGWKAKMFFALAETKEPVKFKHGLRMYRTAPDGSVRAAGHRGLYKYLKRRFGRIPFRRVLEILIEEDKNNV